MHTSEHGKLIGHLDVHVRILYILYWYVAKKTRELLVMVDVFFKINDACSQNLQ